MPGGAPRPAARRSKTSPRVSRPRPGPPTAVTPAPAASPVPTVPIPSDRDRVVTPLLRLPPHPGDTPTAPTKLDTRGDVADLQFADSVPTGSENSRQSRRAMPRCATSLSAGRRPCHPTFCRATPHASVSPVRTSRKWLVKDDYTRPTTTSSYSSVIRRRLTRLARWGERLAY